jgi:phosphoribosylaminoimidazolecarboxamide formyltransferase/IMP cyclohydrolase
MFVDKGDYRIFHGALLAQTRDTQLFDRLVTATNKAFDVEKASNLIAFGLKAVKQIKSNAIAIVRQTENGYLQLAGMGSGQPNRLLSIELALAKAKHTLGVPSLHGIENILLVSDAFFPFEDNIELAFLSGIKTAVEPGGSIRDQKIIDRCNELGMNLILTGTRHFKH